MQSPIPLTSAPLGQSVRIRHVFSHPETSVRLRELGLCEDAIVRCVLRSHGNVICEVLNSRIGLDDGLAEHIIVEAQD